MTDSFKLDYINKSKSKNITSKWIDQVETGQQPDGNELMDHLNDIHDKNAGFTENIAWNSRDIDGKNSYELLADVIDQKHHSKILDLACGSGVLLDLCDKRFNKSLNLSGVDINSAELNLARERLCHTNIKLYESMAQNLNFFSDTSVDVILCHWALTLMDPVIPVFSAVNRLLIKGGVFAAITDGDVNNSSSYHEIHNIIYECVQQELPNYGKIEIGDPRVRTVDGLNELVTKTFIDPKITITPHLLSFYASPNILAQEVAGFFYASFVLSPKGKSKMLVKLEKFFSEQTNNGDSCFKMPINRLIVRQN
jgi:SAM-dependent methyltransferase